MASPFLRRAAHRLAGRTCALFMHTAIVLFHHRRERQTCCPSRLRRFMEPGNRA